MARPVASLGPHRLLLKSRGLSHLRKYSYGRLHSDEVRVVSSHSSPPSGFTPELAGFVFLPGAGGCGGTRSGLPRLPECLPPSSRYVLYSCLLYTSDAADDLLCVDLG